MPPGVLEGSGRSTSPLLSLTRLDCIRGLSSQPPRRRSRFESGTLSDLRERVHLFQRTRRTEYQWVVKAVSMIRDVGIVTVSGTGMMGAPGAPAKVFQTLGLEGINVMIISQGSSEAAISCVVAKAGTESERENGCTGLIRVQHIFRGLRERWTRSCESPAPRISARQDPELARTRKFVRKIIILSHDRDDIFVCRDVVQANPLASILHSRPRDEGILGALHEPRMNLLADISQCGPRGEDQRLLEIRVPVRAFQIDPDEVESLPYPLSEKVHVQSFLRRYRHKVASHLFPDRCEILLIHKIHLVQDDEAPDISPIPSQDVNQLIVRDVFSYQNTTVAETIRFRDSLDSCRRKLRKLHTGRQCQASLVRSGDCHVGWFLVYPNPHFMQFMFQHLHLSGLKHVQDQQDEICVPGHGEDSPSSSFS